MTLGELPDLARILVTVIDLHQNENLSRDAENLSPRFDFDFISASGILSSQNSVSSSCLLCIFVPEYELTAGITEVGCRDSQVPQQNSNTSQAVSTDLHRRRCLSSSHPQHRRVILHTKPNWAVLARPTRAAAPLSWQLVSTENMANMED